MDSLPLLDFDWQHGPTAEEVHGLEWVVTNGLGGYAAGTVLGAPTRRYHGHFIPALPAPLGRAVLLARLGEELATSEGTRRLDAYQHSDGKLDAPALPALRRFRLHGLIPEWEYELLGTRLRRRLFLVHLQNSLHVMYRNEGERELRLRLRPWWVFRPHDAPLLRTPSAAAFHLDGERVEFKLHPDCPAVRARLESPSPAPFVELPETSEELLLQAERSRGYDHHERQHSPGYFGCTLQPGETLSLSVTVGSWEELELGALEALRLEHERQARLLECAGMLAKEPVSARLVLAADQFVVVPPTRPGDEARGLAARSVIAGYPWFTDWGRDTLISLEGLTLRTGRIREAAAILRTFCHHVRDGLLPNLFPEGGREGLYHTADATLWLFHAIHRYFTASGDELLLRALYPVLEDIVAHHLRGTRFGIGVDPADGLLRQGEEGYQLTWMDAKVDGWVVTPRRGKAVELGALWFNALSLMAAWATRLGLEGGAYTAAALRTQVAFNERFWNPETGCLFDVVDGEGGDDASIRPNQLFAISLDHPVLHRARWEPVLRVITDELWTPLGLRTLSPRHPAFQARYDGDLHARDAAYHQGTAWPWLIGHYLDALEKTNGDRGGAGASLVGLSAHLRAACVGQVSEIFDATEPFHARGCFAQAWSVAELLRSWPRPP